jgi:hypothetical protein
MKIGHFPSTDSGIGLQNYRLFRNIDIFMPPHPLNKFKEKIRAFFFNWDITRLWDT